MGIVSVGRSLLIKQLPLVACFALLGAYAYASALGIESVVGDPSVAPANAHAALIGAIESVAARIAIASAAAALVAAGISAATMHFTIFVPLKAVASAIETRSADPVAGAERTDEIGAIARGLRALREEATQAARDAQPATEAASDPRLRSLSERLERFSLDLAANVRRLGTMTKRLGEAAVQMTEAAKHANSGSDQATAASSHAAGDVSSVATASEQLLDSIEEISRQVVQSTSVVRAAVERAVETNHGMGRLSHAAQKVGDVVSLISRIAAQTNLLALNATIEAARAGEAGRGFAVVAQEVKTLATQTAKATQDITGQIADMQQATDLSVEAIGKIQAKISEVEHISTIIASAVHEQGAATQEIARNVRSAAAGTATMSNHMENVVRSVGETSTSAASISALTRELDEIVEGMTDMVSAFSRTLKAA